MQYSNSFNYADITNIYFSKLEKWAEVYGRYNYLKMDNNVDMC